MFKRDRSNLHLAEGRQDVVADHGAVVDLRLGPLLRSVLLEKSRAQVRNGRGPALSHMLTDRIAAVVDVALELLGLLTRGRDAPVAGGADGVAALLTGAASPIVEEEVDRASGRDAGAEAFCIGVVGNAIAGKRPL